MIIGVVFAAALLCWVPSQIALTRTNKTNARLRVETSELEQRIAQASQALEKSRQELRDQQASCDKLVHSVFLEEQELAQKYPDSHWSHPPKSLPEWDPVNPYVWFQKSKLTLFPIPVFGTEGELEPGAVTLLDIDPKTMEALNAQTKQILAEYRQLETNSIEWLDKPLWGIVQDGPNVTLRLNPQPGQAALFQQRFTNAVLEAVGPQRAGLMFALGEYWLDKQFNSTRPEPKTYSIVRHPNGFYNISYQCGLSSGNYGGDFRSVSASLPPHLSKIILDALNRAEKP